MSATSSWRGGDQKRACCLGLGGVRNCPARSAQTRSESEVSQPFRRDLVQSVFPIGTTSTERRNDHVHSPYNQDEGQSVDDQ